MLLSTTSFLKLHYLIQLIIHIICKYRINNNFKLVNCLVKSGAFLISCDRDIPAERDKCWKLDNICCVLLEVNECREFYRLLLGVERGGWMIATDLKTKT